MLVSGQKPLGMSFNTCYIEISVLFSMLTYKAIQVKIDSETIASMMKWIQNRPVLHRNLTIERTN